MTVVLQQTFTFIQYAPDLTPPGDPTPGDPITYADWPAQVNGPVTFAASTAPQVIPDWCEQTKTFQNGLAAGLITIED